MKRRHSFNLVIGAAFLSVVQVASLHCEEAKVSIQPVEKWGNVFAGREAVFHFSVAATRPFRGSVGWAFAIDGRVIERKEGAVEAAPGRDGEVEIKLSVPTVKEGVAIAASLSLSVYSGARGKPAATLQKQIWIFHENPFEDRQEWLKQRRIALFDPDEKSRKVFDEARIPYDKVNSIDALSGLKGGLVIIGEGVSFKDYNALADVVVNLASKGVPVLCLAGSGGELVIPGTKDSEAAAPNAMSFRRNDIIAQLDKRLDSGSWPDDGAIVVSSIVVNGERRVVSGEFTSGGDGWPWVELDFGKAKCVLCGFAMTSKWDKSPAPRYLLLRLLEYMSGK